MKTFSAGLAAAYASDSASICNCLRVLRADGVILNFTSTDRPVKVGGEVYESATGLDISALVAQSQLAVDNLDLVVNPDEQTYPQTDILAGQWDGARFWLFQCDYTDPSIASGVFSVARTELNLLKRGTTGEADTLRASNRFEFRGLKQALQQQLGRVTLKTCPYRLGSTAQPDGLCFVDLGPWTHTYAVTALGADPRRDFTVSASPEVTDYYTEGTATMTDGESAGYSQKVKSFAAGGIVVLSLEMPYSIGIGDHVRLVAGCQKRLLEDCKAKFNNVLNFGGEPHMVGPDVLTADPVAG